MTTYILGKADYNGSGREDCECTFEWELKDGRFSMSAYVWNPRHSDLYVCGQCCEEVAAYFPDNKKAQRMVEIWRRWHLNDMRAGSPAQENSCRKRTRRSPGIQRAITSGPLISWPRPV